MSLRSAGYIPGGDTGPLVNRQQDRTTGGAGSLKANWAAVEEEVGSSQGEA